MQLTTREQFVTLQSWSFVVFYQQNRTALADLARRTYNTLRSHTGDPWVKAEVTADILVIALQGALIFIKICEEKETQGANPMLREVFARALARYIIDMDWPAIAMLRTLGP